MKRLFFAICFFLFVTTVCHAQAMLGISNSNYAGNAGMNLNPAAMLYMPSKWELGIVTMNVQLENNYIGLPRQPLSRMGENGALPHGGLVDNFNSRSKHAGAHVLVKIPSFILKVNEWAFSYSMNVRSDLSVRNIDPVLAKVLWDGMQYAPIHGRSADLSGTHIASLSWVESSFSVGKQLSKSDTRRWLVAATGKYITGIQGAQLSLNSGDVQFINDTMITMNNINGNLGYGMLSSPSQLTHFKLNGIGTDVGVCYVSNPYMQRFSNGRPVPTKRYEYRLGISLIDLGIVHFAGNATRYSIMSDAINYNNIQAIQVNGQQGLDSMLQASYTNRREPVNVFNIGLPLATSIQYDRCLHPRWYLNLTAVQRLPLPYAHVKRANILSAAIRYETPYFEIAMPYSLYDYYRHRIGLSMRYHFLFIGTDRLGTFYGSNQIRGVDVYFGIKLQSIEFQHKKKGGKVVRCAAYS